MITKAQIRFIRSLEAKKSREEYGCFVVEGEKMVGEALNLPAGGPFEVTMVIATESWIDQRFGGDFLTGLEIIGVSPAELERISMLKTPNRAMAVIRKKPDADPFPDPVNRIFLGLDRVQDPGNVGTIIRIADWFGIDGIVASPETADFFSPKVVQSSMGSIFRVHLKMADLGEFIRSLPGEFPVFATRLDGYNIYCAPLAGHGMILMGNESKGLAEDLAAMATQNLAIPGFASGATKPESLNVSIAAAIVCSEFRRRQTG